MHGRLGVQKLVGNPDGSNWFLEVGPGFYDLDPENAESKRGLSFNVGVGQQFLLGPRATVYRWEFRPELLSDMPRAAGRSTSSDAGLVLGRRPGRSGTRTASGIFDCGPVRRHGEGGTRGQRGCPRDSDGDGVPDGLDRCPDTPKGFAVDAQGCPKDADRDGVPDGADRCPDTPAGAKVDAQGCPLDADGDGVYDGIDQCPDTPRGATVDTRGCPLDTDGDGIYDGLDRCPGTPRGTKVDATGCPLPETKAAPIFEPGKTALVLEGINFEVNKAALTPDSAAVLDKVAASLRDWPEVRVEVGGHTDSDGSTAYNFKLSQRRADAVMQYLAHGIAIAHDRQRLRRIKTHQRRQGKEPKSRADQARLRSKGVTFGIRRPFPRPADPEGRDPGPGGWNPRITPIS
jgi:OOP family OmpA-OmpF porin